MTTGELILSLSSGSDGATALSLFHNIRILKITGGHVDIFETNKDNVTIAESKKVSNISTHGSVSIMDHGDVIIKKIKEMKVG
mgnify:CR=1 FL=1|jgi:hypothetical protein